MNSYDFVKVHKIDKKYWNYGDKFRQVKKNEVVVDLNDS